MTTDERGMEAAPASAIAAHAALFDRVADRKAGGPRDVPLNAMRQPAARRASFAYFDDWLLTRDLKDKRVLDLGCGRGEVSVQLALLGARVTGIDISPQSLEKARALGAKHGVSDRMTFREGEAENLPFDDDAFDLVVSAGVMSFVNFDTVVMELARVLQRDGTMVLLETLGHNPIAGLGRRRRLSRGETTQFQVDNIMTCYHLDRLRAHFGLVEVKAFDFLTVPMMFVEGALQRLHPRLPALVAPVSALLRVLDRFVLRWPPLRRYAFRVVVTLRWPREPHERA